MSAAARERRPDAGASGAAGQKIVGTAEGYPQKDWKASSAKARLTAMKFKWLMQVASDSSLPPAAAPIAIYMAAKFLHPETMEAWPSIATLARLIGRSETQTRKGLHALVERGHLDVEMTRGGKGKTSRYRLAILPAKPLGKPQGINLANPAENDRQTLRKSNAKPCGNPQGIPYDDPFNDPRQARSAPADGDHPDSGSRDMRLKRTSPDPVCRFKIGNVVNVPGHDPMHVDKIGFDGSEWFLKLKEYADFDMDAMILPLDCAGDPQFDRSWWEDGNEAKTDRIDWNPMIINPVPKSRRKQNAAA